MNRKISKGLNLLLVITMILTNLIGLSIPDRVNAASATDLFFSEYIEGSSNNKGIEIFNGTGSDVDLSQYTVELYSNGNTSAGSTTTLDGSLESGNVYIIVNSSANDEMKSISNATSGVANFNGDDTLILKNNGQIIDVFGQVGVDPGDGWGTNEEAKDHTLVRKSSVVSGDTDSSNPFDPTAEWDVYPKDTFTYLGSHTMDGFGDEEPVPEKVENVTASPMAGQVQKGTEIMLSTDTEDATVYYAVYTDSNNDVSYEVFNGNSPIAVNEPLTIKTYASKDGLEDSDISEFEYSLIEEMTIIQARQEPSNTIVIVEGIITSASGNVYIQDETAGINLYNQSDDIEIAEGDLVKVTGTVTEYNGLLELKNYTVEKISSANPLPEPQEITIDQIGEEYEGELVKVSNVTIGVINTSGNTSLSDDLGNSVNVYRIPELTDITEGDKVDVVAIVSQFNDYQLYVRNSIDVTKTSAVVDYITIAEAREQNLDEEVTVRGIVTSTEANTFIQDATGGINLYSQSDDTEIVEGDLVKVTGTVTEYNGLLELKNYTVEKISSENSLPEVQEITIDQIGEEYEGELVKLTNVTIGAINTSGNTTLTDDSDNSINVYKIPELTDISEGDKVDVVAIVSQFNDYQLYVRKAGDVSQAVVDYITIAEAREQDSNTEAIVRGIVTSASGNVYIQDETAGINLYNQSDDIEIAEGDLVKVTGTVTEYNGLLELKNYTVEKISSENSLPEVQEITIDQIGEEYEGELVKLTNVTIGAINTSGNTTLTDDSDNSINVYKIPELTDISEGDKVDVVAIVSQFNDYQLYVRKAGDVTKTDLGPDTEAPVITHIAVTEGNIGQDLEIKASVTDDRQVSNVKLYYKVTGTTEYQTIDMNLSDGEYSAVISKDQLSTDGIAYYIEATDGTNTITSPEDTNTPYEVTITDDDILGPEITTVIPSDDEVLLDTETKPGIRAEFNDPSGIDTDTVKILLDGIDVTTGATVKEDSVSYYPEQDLELGAHEVTVEVSDTVGNDTSFTWTFNIGEEEYNFYYGQLHSHTNVSDGQGSLDDAYSWARDEGQADFFAVTDHSNWFDNESDRANENITDVSQSTSDEWKEMHTVADSYNSDGEFVALAGFEMTWSGSTGGWGHINTFNTPWFSSRTNSNMDLPAYYEHIAADTDSLSQLNHPGKTFGDFADFSFYSESADNVVHLIEVGNGEGPIRGSGYFPSYDYYTRALDKGWHLGPSNNQDNHKGQWITSNDARTVVLAPELTRSNIYDGIRNLRFYATEDKNLEIIYKVNGNIMGTTLDDPESLDISIEINDPDETDEIGKISIISNGGVEVASKTFEDNEAIWELELDPQYSYYYVRVDQGDKDIAVTAPVWTDEVTPVGISKVEVSQDPQIVNKPIEINATVYNNGPNMINDIKVEFYKDSIETDNKIGESTVGAIASGSTGLATMEWTSDEVGEYNIYAQTTINIDGVDKVFYSSTSVTYADPEDVTKIVLDTGHYNAYISGYYAGKYETLKDIFKENKFMLVENKDELTSEDLQNAQLLIITDPQSTDDPDYDLTKSLYTDSEVAAIKEYTDNGGPLIVASRADYKDGTGEYSNGVQLNKILEAVGTNLRVNDDEVVDDTTNGGQPYRLYFDKYESTKYNLAENVPEGTTYSFYSGCSVITKDGGSDEAIDWLVKGHETTETLDSDYQGDNVPVTMGDVKVIGAEELSNGARIIVAGSIFFSDFETASSDDMYSNRQITENIINWMVQPKEVELKTIAKVREDKDNDGIPDHLGEKFSIIGRVTAQSEAVTPKNSFFEVIYVQDETGGITVFGVSATPLPLGTKVRITGVVDQYDGDAELSVENENNDVVILDDEVALVDPKIMTTGDSMLEENEGWLVKVQGTVTRMTENSLYLDDGSGEARIYVNGYIGDGTGNSETLGKWDPSIEVGDNVSAIGLASQDPEGHRIRVRNTTEIVKLEEVDYPVEIPSVNTSDINGNLTENFEEEDVVMVNTELTNIIDEAISGTVIIKLVDSEDRTYAIGFVNGIDLDAEEVRSLSLGFKVNGVSKGTHTAKVYLWSDLTDRTPLSEVGAFEFTVE